MLSDVLQAQLLRSCMHIGHSSFRPLHSALTEYAFVNAVLLMEMMQQDPMASIARQAWHEVLQDPAPGCQSTTKSLPILTLDTCWNNVELKRGRYSVISTAEASGLGRVCIKTYDRPSLVPRKQKMATREAIVLKYLNSMGVPNITHMWSAYASQDKFHILMEYCAGGNLLDRLKAAPAPMAEQQLAALVS
eukprot:GHRQ01015757.1.p1 GENE.GHRQ01015757.1~~GHRQ01015757.1.p1  ORF type:complete len:191 (+),score=35.25 GHRQ01015757.1:148-720(+)